MKKILLSALLALFTVNTAIAAHPQCGETELAQVMGDMKDNMKAIKKAVKSDDSESLDTTVTKLLNNIQKSEKLVPLTITDKKELTAEQKSELADYKKGKQALHEAATELSQATTAEQRKAALGKIGKAAKKGHKAFKMDCDE